MACKIQKWGNSLGIRIPKSIIEKTNLAENDDLIIEKQDGKIIIFPAKKKLLLKDLVNQVTSSNLHQEDDFKSEGNEVW